MPARSWCSGLRSAPASLSPLRAMPLFPFYLTDIAGMQISEVLHAVVAVLFVAVILAHIHIGTLGMEGAFEAMGTGEVDLNWAKEHHDLWLRDQLAKQPPRRRPGQSSATPAE
jgi:formate dehydrogenase subunit gamma